MQGSRRCLECGEGLIRPFGCDGRTMPYKDAVLPVPPTLLIPTCSDCGSQWIDGATARTLDDALEEVYVEHLKRECVRLARQLGDQYREMTEELRAVAARWRKRRDPS